LRGAFSSSLPTAIGAVGPQAEAMHTGVVGRYLYWNCIRVARGVNFPPIDPMFNWVSVFVAGIARDKCTELEKTVKHLIRRLFE
jgi:hypothetical protein